MEFLGSVEGVFWGVITLSVYDVVMVATMVCSSTCSCGGGGAMSSVGRAVLQKCGEMPTIGQREVRTLGWRCPGLKRLG